MKTKNNFGSKMLIALLALSALSMTACKNNDNSNGTASTPQPVQVGWQGCTMCVTSITQPADGLIGVLSITPDQKVAISLDIIIDAAQAMGANVSDPKAILYYNGRVALQGAIRIAAHNNFALCGAVPGDYAFLPLTPSTVSQMGVLQGGQFEATSTTGARFMFSVGGSSIYNRQDPNGVSRNSQTNRVNLQLRIDSVNGTSCGQFLATS